MTPQERRIRDALREVADSPELHQWAAATAAKHKDDYDNETSDDRALGFMLALDLIVVVAFVVRAWQVLSL